MKRALALVLLAAVWLAAPVSCIGAGGASLSMPVRGVWMHPGFFGTDKTAAVEKMRLTIHGYVRAGINTLIMCVKNTSS
jgi:uncharacterized lipoprotein YddW (UPF0748 family)